MPRNHILMWFLGGHVTFLLNSILISGTMLKYFFLLISIFSALGGAAQELDGKWIGWLSQDGKTDTFHYEINIAQKGDGISGVAFSSLNEGKVQARFVLSGIKQGDKIVLQEVEQIEPEKPKWCFKYMTLNPKPDEEDAYYGTWTADGCTPGKVYLARPYTQAVPEREQAFTYEGRWTGHVSQSDRAYGFFFEVDLKPDGTGVSTIVSEGNGGTAHLAFDWDTLTEAAHLRIMENAVIDKTDSKWPWCIKNAALYLTKVDGKYLLDGEWTGHIEDHDIKSGSCAPGTMHLERPILKQENRQRAKEEFDPYQAKHQRTVKIDKVLQVQSKNLKIKVWDNGTVDGDFVTLLLNGKKILDNFRVDKRKWSIPVQILDGDNFLILHAEDLGDISPNTVAVSIYDGVKEEIIVLSSNLEVSGAIMIKPFRF